MKTVKLILQRTLQTRNFASALLFIVVGTTYYDKTNLISRSISFDKQN